GRLPSRARAAGFSHSGSRTRLRVHRLQRARAYRDQRVARVAAFLIRRDGKRLPLSEINECLHDLPWRFALTGAHLNGEPALTRPLLKRSNTPLAHRVINKVFALKVGDGLAVVFSQLPCPDALQITFRQNEVLPAPDLGQQIDVAHPRLRCQWL